MFFTGSKYKYSNDEKHLSTKEIKDLVSRIKVRTLDKDEEVLVENEILSRRGSDGKISMRQIEEILRNLMNKNKISRADKEKLIQIFGEKLS